MNEFFENVGVDSLSAGVQESPYMPEVRFSANYDPQGELNQKAFDALVRGWNSDANARTDEEKKRRDAVAVAFGQEWLDMYDKEHDYGKASACAMRYLRTKFFEQTSERKGIYDDYGAVYSYKQATGATDIKDFADMWEHYKRTRGAELDRDDARLAQFRELTSNAQSVITKRLMGDFSEPLPDDNADIELKAWMSRFFENDADRRGYEKACQAMSLIRAQQAKKVEMYIHETGFVEEDAYNEGDILKLRDAVADNLLDGRGELDEAALKWFRIGLSGFAAELKERDPGAAERFGISMRQMIENIRAFGEDEDLPTATSGAVATMPSLGLPTGEGIPWSGSDYERTKKESREAFLSNEARLNAADSKRAKRMLVGGEMNKAIRRGLEFKDGTPWWEQAYKGAVQMAPQTIPWLVPYAGLPLGAATSFASQSGEGLGVEVADFQEKYGRMPNAYEMAGLGLRAYEDATISAAVEMLPGQAVGIPFTRLMSKLTGARFGVGAIARRVARLGENRFAAVAMDTAAGVVEEAIFEPVAQGIMTLGADAMMEQAQIPAVQRRSVGKVFAELQENVTNPGQLGAIALTVSVLGGGNIGRTLETSKLLREHSELLLAAGMSEADVAKVRLSGTPVKTAAELYAKALEEDMPAVLERIKEEARKNNQTGELLRRTGRQDVGDADLQRSLKASWDYLAEQGILPQVEERPDGRFHVSKKVTGENGSVTLKEYDMEAAEADAFISMCVSDAEAVCVGAKQASVWGLQQEAVRQIYGESAARAIFQNGKSHGLFIQDVSEAEGMSPELAEEARKNRFAMTAEWLDKAAAQLGGKWVQRAEQFKKRLDLEGLDYDAAGSRLFRDRVGEKAEFGGRSVWGSMLTYVRGQATASDAVEDVFESVADMQIAARAEEIAEANEELSAGEAWGQAVREMAAKVKPVIEGMAMLSESPQLKAMAKEGNWTEDRLYMATLEAMSHIAKSEFLSKRDSLPASWRGGLDAAYDALDYAHEMKQFADAYKAVKEAGTVDVAPLEDVLAAQGVVVNDVFRDARVDEQVIASWRKAKGMVAARAAVEGTGAVGVQEALESAEESEREIAEAEAARDAVPPLSEEEQKEAAQQLNEELASTPPPPPAFSAAPEEMKGVFLDDSCTYRAGGFYSGWVAVDKLRDSAEIQQVKVGDKGKHGVTNALVGEFRMSAPPIFVWRRKNGDLEVISGRHRYAHAEACGVKFIRADVYNEDAEHDAKWARLLDFENNMCDDQADEKTAFIYVRETGYDDETLYKKGLLRDKTKSKRGAMIARHAREELATRFMNDAVSAKDAETICTMTKDIADKGRIEEIQRRCCMLLDERKSWEYIGAMVQLMASKESVYHKQGLLDLGADFEADLARAAKYIETCTRQLNEAIAVMKSGRKMSGKQAELARRLGQLTTSAEDSQQRLDALSAMKAMFDNIGMYPDLVSAAQMWDGKTEVDAVGMALNRGMQEAKEYEEGSKMSVEERLAQAEAEANRRAAEEATGSLFGASFSVTSGEITRVRRDEVPENKADLVARLKKIAGVKFKNAAASIEASISGDSANKIAFAEKETIANLARLGYSEEEAGYVHRAAAVKIGELFEKSELYFEEPVYHKKDSRERAWHFFEPVEVEVNGKDASYLANVSVIEFTHGSERLFSLELTIENPISNAEDMAAPLTGRQALHPNGVSDVRLAAFDSFVKKERVKIERKAREKGLLPWRVDEARVNELRGEANKIRKDIEALRAKFGGDETKLQQYSRDQKKLHALREALARKQAEIDAESKPDGMPDLDAPLAPNGKPSKLSVDDWVTVRTQAFKDWFGDWENDPKNASKVVDENGEPLVVYHGTVHGGFRVFNVDGRGKTEGSGAFFTSDKRVAEGYGAVFHTGGAEPQVYACFLNIREPYVVDFEGNSWNKVPGRAAGYFVHYDNGESEWFDNKADADFEVSGYEGKAEIEEDWEESPTLDDLAREVWEESPEVDGIIAENVVDAAVGAGKSYPATDYIVASPNQIKSATDNRGTFDGGNADITFSVIERADKSRYVRVDNPVHTEKEARAILTRKKNEMTHIGKKGRVFGKPGYGLVAPGTDYEVFIMKSSIESILSGKHVKESVNPEVHYAAAAVLDELWLSSHFFQDHDDTKGKPGRDIKQMHRRMAEMHLNGKVYEVKLTAKEYAASNDTNTLYMLKVEGIKEKSAKASEEAAGNPGESSPIADREMVAKGELVVKRGGDGFSASVMTGSQRREAVKNELARVAAMDKQVAVLADDWERVLGDLDRVSRGGEETKLGDGARLYAEMVSLISATRAVLPPHLARLGNLNGLMHWAAAYAEMVQHGELPLRGGVIKGAIAEKFLQAMQKRRDALLLQGLSEQEAKEAMAQVGAEKLNAALKKVAVACRDQLNRYVKERAWERIETLAERAMPKSEPGHRSHKGKMDAAHYKEMSAALHALNLTEEGMEKEQNELLGRIRALTGTEEGYEETYRELQDALNRLNLYGCWHAMSASHALKAADAFAALVQDGRQQWKETLDVQRRHKLWLMGRMAEGMQKTATANAVNEEQNTDAVGVLRAPARGAKDLIYGLMNMSHLLQAKRRELGDTVVTYLQNMLLHAQEGKHREKSRRDRYIAERLRIFFGCKSEADATRTLNELQRRRTDHNIRTWKLEKHTYTLDRAEAEEWAAMTREQREEVRKKDRAEAEKKKLAPPERVAEADIARLQEVLTEMNTRTRTLKSGKVKETPSKAKTVNFTVRRWNKKPAETLNVSRLNVANALLILEQPGYAHLVEDWGLVRYNAAGAELSPGSEEFETGYDLEATLKPLYDFVGDTCMDLCYELRAYIDEYVRPLTEEAYNRRMGVPLRTLPLYWPGTFNISTMSAKDVLTENGGGSLGQTASFTINRVVLHHAAADWNKDALEVFFRATDEQLNYVYVGELTNALRDMFMNDAFVKKLEVNCGAQWVKAVKDMVLILDNSVALDAVNMQAMGKVLSRFFGQLAKDALSFNFNSYTKQASGVLNGLTAGMVPRRVIERSDGAKELAYGKVGILEWSAALGRVASGKGRVSIEALRKREFWLQRYNDPRIQERLRKAAALGSARQSVYAGVLAETGLRAMSAIDRACNAPGLLALADVFYRRLETLNGKHGLGLTVEEMEEQALDAVGRALDVGAQPMTNEQKAGLLATGGGMSRFVLQTATMFKSEIFKDLAQLGSQCMSGQWGAAMAHYLLRGSFNYGVVCLLALLRFGGDDDDDDKDETWVKAVKFVTASLTSDLSAVPVFGELPGGVYNWASGRGSWQQSVPVAGDIELAYRSAVRLAEKGDSMDEADIARHCKRVMRGLALLLVPFSFSQGRLGSVSDAVLDASVIMNPVKMGTEVYKAHVQEE